MDIKNVKITEMEFEGIDTKDYPDFCDVFCSDCLIDGTQATDEQLEDLNDNHWYYVYEVFMEEMHNHV